MYFMQFDVSVFYIYGFVCLCFIALSEVIYYDI